ncbi:hypothetical protein ANSO36C_53440 [Nostoc cf. commune SO-36]|uniref:Uncharacterized protein n=1 Tax=Nostoc cf. commune SO-36 TaxID=449208 RepID=A0ABM7Z8L6_NOSCO|nr:hypothetical protein ANSO36C_53440 [Nostoc cf. commune SO-36]
MTTKPAPNIAIEVKCSGGVQEGAITDKTATNINVTIGAKAITALTRDASQCSNDSAKAPVSD